MSPVGTKDFKPYRDKCERKRLTHFLIKDLIFECDDCGECCECEQELVKILGLQNKLLIK